MEDFKKSNKSLLQKQLDLTLDFIILIGLEKEISNYDIIPDSGIVLNFKDIPSLTTFLVCFEIMIKSNSINIIIINPNMKELYVEIKLKNICY
jgi:hypothetical protein